MINHHSRQVRPPILLIHGGAGVRPKNRQLERQRAAALNEIINQVWPALQSGMGAAEAADQAVRHLEDCPLFNAGRGAVLQSDGLARLSASLMDGEREKFSGVMLATHLCNPSQLAAHLQTKEESVVGPLGAQLIARELGIPPQSPLTTEAIEHWAKTQKAGPAHGTVGAVVMDQQGRLAAATSTGGHGANFPERISDSATVAGNYASAHAAISCTGIGEQIVDAGLAVRLETRVRDGGNIVTASQQCLAEAKSRNHQYGWIGIDHLGNWAVYSTTETIAWATADGNLLPQNPATGLSRIQTKRVYLPPAVGDGKRFLVDHFWPRGMRKADLPMTQWLKEVAPSSELRRWFNHDPAKWKEFKQRYFDELEGKPEVWRTLLEASKSGPVTLLYAAKDESHNNAVALKEFLENQLGAPSSCP